MYALLVGMVIFGGATGSVSALTSSSTNYQATEMEFNAGQEESCSASYCSKASIGDMTLQEEARSSNNVAFGASQGTDPLLEVIVEPGESNLGVLTAETTATKTMMVRVHTYLSEGYTMQIVGDAPKYGDHTLASPSDPTSSAPGTEQFAINLSDNVLPNIGAGPEQVPSGDFSFGTVESNYSTPNQFKYTSGETVARSNSATGQTNYTVSFIVNIANNTPAGHYSGDYSVVVVPVY